MTATVPPWARICVAAALFVALSVEAAVAPARLLGSGGPDRLALLAALRSGDYARLDRYLTQLQDDYESGTGSEARLERAYRAFASADPVLRPKLDEWVYRQPRSFAARLARSEYLAHLGRLRHRTQPPPPTGGPPEPAPSELLAQARHDLLTALDQRPHLGIAYRTLIDIAMFEGKIARADSWFDLGLEADPGSAALHRAYLLSLRPWRRPDDSPDQVLARLNQVVEGLAAEDDIKPDLAVLRGFPDFVTAELLRRQRRHDQAERYYAEALKYGDDWLFLRQAGINAFQEGRFVETLRRMSYALVQRPENPTLLDWRARTHWALGNREPALRDWLLALSLDPMNPDILLGHAQALRDLGQIEAAAHALDEATLLGRDHLAVRRLRGQLLMSDFNRPEDAIPDLRRAVELDPYGRDSLRAYAEALYRSKRCEAASEALASYRRLCENGNRCAEEDLNWAREALRGTRRPDGCPAYGVLGP